MSNHPAVINLDFNQVATRIETWCAEAKEFIAKTKLKRMPFEQVMGKVRELAELKSVFAGASQNAKTKLKVGTLLSAANVISECYAVVYEQMLRRDIACNYDTLHEKMKQLQSIRDEVRQAIDHIDCIDMNRATKPEPAGA